MAEIPLCDGWVLARTAPGVVADPAGLASHALDWQPAVVPGTVAGARHTDINLPGPYDDSDWWYCHEFVASPVTGSGRQQLCFEGLATLCRAWLNGTLILTSRNMFRRHVVDVTTLIRDKNSLVLVFDSLSAAAAQRLPRPRWKTALVEQQTLRHFRTTLLGRIPGWTPPVTPVGPWRPVTVVTADRVLVHANQLQADVQDSRGIVRFHASLEVLGRARVEGARLRAGERVVDLRVLPGADPVAAAMIEVRGDLVIPDVPLWWPHTHGSPHRVAVSAELLIDGEWLSIAAATVGFRSLRLDQDQGGVRLVINGVPVFCRGACWTTADILTLRGDEQALRPILETARRGGLNMVRIGGTMAYESDTFYRLCDELGILVWQDFMFANMDYPVGDPQFLAEIVAEATDQLNRLQRHACIAAYCGGSEVAQQAAMMGRPAADWTNEFFSRLLPSLCAEWHPGVPYFPSSPWGGALPFHAGSGIAHYYGVGAYKRPLTDVKHAGVRFTTECLGFSNVPDRETVALLSDGRTVPPHHPRWKARQPRDSGAGWDFEDIRDHYFRELFGTDPIELRSVDVERYYAMSRVVTGELMQRVFSEWRQADNPCEGGIVWFLQDLWPGAGWGIIDSTGRPKAAYWYLRRAWASLAVRLIDSGLDGLTILLLNDSAEPVAGQVELELYHLGRATGPATTLSVQVPARGSLTLQADAMLGYFADLTWAYRFGPSKHEVAAVRWLAAEDGRLLAEDFHFPCGLCLPAHHDPSVVAAVAEWDADNAVRVVITSPVFLQSVSVSCNGFLASDDYFHVSPNCPKHIVFTAAAGTRPENFKAELAALNLAGMVTVRAAAPAATR